MHKLYEVSLSGILLGVDKSPSFGGIWAVADWWLQPATIIDAGKIKSETLLLLA